VQQNLYVLQGDAAFTALTEVTREVVHASPDAGATIQAAIDALDVAGGAVTLGPGVFPLNEPVRLASAVWLRGSGRGTRLLVAPANRAGIGLLAEGLHGAVVSDLALQPAERASAEAGLVLDGCGDCSVRAVFSADFAGYGLLVRGSSFLCAVEGCSLAGNRRANLLLDELRAGPHGNYIPSRVAGCTIYGGGAGIECRRAIAVSITGCIVHQSNGAAYHIHGKSHAVAISSSRSYQVTGDAVRVEESHELSVTGNVFCWHTGYGILVRESSWGAISGNQIVDSGSYNPGGPDRATAFDQLPPDLPLHDGISLQGARGYQVTGNAIFNWGVAPPLRYGIREDERSLRNSLIGNSVNYFREAAVRSEGRETLARDNQEHPDAPYAGVGLAEGASRMVQSFERELTDAFIAAQTGRGTR
jgi:hypothetical protein